MHVAVMSSFEAPVARHQQSRKKEKIGPRPVPRPARLSAQPSAQQANAPPATSRKPTAHRLQTMSRTNRPHQQSDAALPLFLGQTLHRLNHAHHPIRPGRPRSQARMHLLQHRRTQAYSHLSLGRLLRLRRHRPSRQRQLLPPMERGPEARDSQRTLPSR